MGFGEEHPPGDRIAQLFRLIDKKKKTYAYQEKSVNRL